jgi:hypothetical protein
MRIDARIFVIYRQSGICTTFQLSRLDHCHWNNQIKLPIVDFAHLLGDKV